MLACVEIIVDYILQFNLFPPPPPKAKEKHPEHKKQFKHTKLPAKPQKEATKKGMLLWKFVL